MKSDAIRSRPPATSATSVTRGASSGCGSEAMLQKIAEIPVVARVLSSAEPLPQQQSRREHIERVLGNYDRYFACRSSKEHVAKYNEGMRLAAIVSCISREIARELGDPHLGPVLAAELLEVYQPAFEVALDRARATPPGLKNAVREPPRRQIRREHGPDPAVRFAQSIVCVDPITLYLQEKIKLERAAGEIRRLAVSEGKDPASLCAQLIDQFQIVIGAFDGDQVRDKEADDIVRYDPVSGTRKVKKANFALEDLYGEVSVKFCHDVVDVDTNMNPKWRKVVGCLTKLARGKLEFLKAEVNNPQLVPVPLSNQELDAERLRSSSILNINQLAHFAKLRSAEERELLTRYEENSSYDMDREEAEFREQSTGKTPKEYVLAQISKLYGVDLAEAVRIKDAIIVQLEHIPLTITCDVSRMFRRRADNRALPFYGTKYMNRQVLALHEYRLRDIFLDPAIPESRTVASIGHASQDYVEGRGANYMRWRREKDERETGFRGFAPGDLPVFGAINPNFDKLNRDGCSRRTNDRKASRCSDDERFHGVNYYGDIHFLLKPEVRSRSTFIARGANRLKRFRIERLDLLLLLADMFRLSMHEYLDAIVAAAHGNTEIFVTRMEGEVHVYGGLDLTRDVKEVYVPSKVLTATDGSSKRLLTFAENHGIAVKDIGVTPIRFRVHPGLVRCLLTNEYQPR